MSETTPTYPRLPLSEVPGYVPDGLVWVEWTHIVSWAAPWWGQFDSGGRLFVADTEIPCNPRRDDCDLILDPTGAASLARAVAARVGLDVSGGVAAGFHVGRLMLAVCPDTALDLAKRDLRDATDTLDALAIVARAVLT